MYVWRVARSAHAQQALSGEGARRYGGRWNHIGLAVVYTSQSLSLAVLEYLVNLAVADLPDDLVSIEIEIPDNLPHGEIHIHELPEDWRTFPAIEKLKDLGTDWAQQATTPILLVPSVVIPSEHNWLVNPAHPLSNRVKILTVEPFALDTRLYRVRKRAR
jgi:RES domain-containing protein